MPQGRKEVSYIQTKLELLQTEGTVERSLNGLKVLALTLSVALIEIFNR